MMKRFLRFIVPLLVLGAVSCARTFDEGSAPQKEEFLPLGVPTMLTIPFGSGPMTQVSVGTRADAGEVNEAHIHDLYVFIFDKDDTATGSPRKIYGRYFNYDHKRSSLTELNNKTNECWYVENKDLSGAVDATRGAVKISTVTCANVALVMLANVSNAVMGIDSSDDILRLNAIEDLDELRSLTVELEQDVVNRKDLFFMMGTLGYDDGRTINTASMKWNQPAPNDLQYNPDYKLLLRTVNAKVKFRIKVNPTYISAVTPVYWQVHNTPSNCYLFSDYNDGKAPENVRYFASQQFYFEDTEEIAGETYYSFCFYMLENRLRPNRSATNYYQREKRRKTDSGEDGYKGPSSAEFGSNFVDNGDWEFANPNSTYVQFDLVLTLTPAGIEQMGEDDDDGLTIGHALTSDAIFTVHLGDFTSSGKPDGWSGFDDYNTERGNFYTYTVTVNNTKSIYTEVTADNEVQPGQEGFLLLTDAEIINADAHYEYHQITFDYRPDMSQDKFSWYVKTPFSEGGPDIVPLEDGLGNPTGEYDYEADGGSYTIGGVAHTGPTLDYRWVLFGINGVVDGKYTDHRHAYPGRNHYDPDWKPGQLVGASHACNVPGRVRPDLMDITQLIQFIFYETGLEKAHRLDPSAPESLFISDDGVATPVIRVTAFIDEFYYEENPITHEVDRDLWRHFVNAQPRELHILSDARPSRDRGSDVILSSHSIIQQSIQTIYNIYSPDLQTLWGCEHKDEMRAKTDGWPYWPYAQGNGTGTDGREGNYNTLLGRENGRLNSAYIWDFFSKNSADGVDRTDRTWSTYLDYNVANNVPELVEAYHGMAWSCLTRNRDNDGDGVVDRDEVRWYLAASGQLIGMWVGNDALSLNARLYQPAEGQWRAHIISSTGHRVAWAEEGAGATPYIWDFENGRHTWSSITEASRGESVRCVRNIGTYDNGGTLADISSAPYPQEIDQYFTFTDNGDDSYTFYFDRLNPMTLRELCEGELPYHDQHSVSNNVYLQMTTQKRADNVGDTASDAFSIRMDAVNQDVTAKGYNPYCPPGYRFPNQTEMLLMSIYVPNSFFDKDKDGVDYPSSGYHMPTRTYFDRGCYGGLTTNMSAEEISWEQGKVGWDFDTKDNRTHCANRTQLAVRSRCVRDDNMTGYIDGGLTMPTDELFPNDWQDVKISFFSTASAFVSASLKLCYTNHDGNYIERDIPLSKGPTGMQYQADQRIEIPTLATLGLDAADLDTDKKNMKFKVELRNAAGQTRSFETPFHLASHLTGSSISLPGLSDPDKGMPVRVTVGSKNNHSKLSNVVLHWKEAGGSWNTKELVAHDYYSSYTEDVYTRDIIGDAAWAVAANRTKEYLYYITADCNDGTSFTSSTLSEQILRLNYNPNPVPAGGWTNISQCSTTWKDTVTGLDFLAGDFIEADMDVSNCRYVFVDGNKNNDIGQDNLMGFSTNNIGDIANSLIWYYPSVQNLVNSDDPAAWGWIRSRVHAGRWSALEITEGIITHLNLILDKDGIIRDGTRWNRNPGDWNSRVKAALTSASSVQIGSTEGVHHSRAIYNYVRVVRYK